MNSLRVFNRRIVENASTYARRLLSTKVEGFKEKPRTEKCMNKVTLLGRVGKEGEMRGTTDHPCLIFPMATSFTYRKASTGDYMTKTDWHRICVFQPGLRTIASTIEKGDRILVEGSLSHQRYMDDNNQSVNVTSVIAEEIVFLGRRRARHEDEEEHSL